MDTAQLDAIVTSWTERRWSQHRRKRDLLTNVFTSLVFLCTLAAPSGVDGCPSPCTCSSREVWCPDAGLTEIPSDLPTEIKYLYLFNNQISNIPEGSLTRFTNLQLLDLSSNRLTNQGLRSNELNKLTKLEELILDENMINTVSSNMFAGMQKLVRLYLDDNDIQSVEQNAIRNMSSLLELILSNNNMRTFPKISGTPKLQRLHLDGNRLTRLQFNSFVDVNLEELTVAGNKLTQLPSTAFKDTSNLRILDISNNLFRKVPKIIRNMTALMKLNLSMNAISTLPSDLIHGQKRLKELDIHNMQLTTLAKGFIPSGVYFNWADFSGNAWKCDCDLSWLFKIMRQQTGVFKRASQVQCHQPDSLRGQQLRNIQDQALNCASNPPNGGGADGGTTAPGRPKEPVRPPIQNTCPFMNCKNGAKCYMNGSRPVCRCLPGWKGLTCSIRVAAKPTTTTTVMNARSTTTPLSAPSLQFDRETLTENSVVIFVPKTGNQITVTVTEVERGRERNPRSWAIFLSNSQYTVQGLKAGKRYRICISMLDESNPDHVFEDKLCGVIATPGESSSSGPPPNTSNTTDKVSVPVDDPTTKSKPGDGASKVTNNEATKAEFQLFYPVLAAGLGAFVILVVVIMFYVCYRNKQKLKHANNNDHARSPQPEFAHGSPANDNEMVPMMAAKQRYMTQPAMTTAMIQNGDVCHVQQHPNIQAMCVSPKRVGTPPKTGSLGRSSNSGGSMSGTQVQYPVDRQRCYSTGSANGQIHQVPVQVTIEDIRCQTSPTHTYQANGGIYSTHSPYTSPQPPYTSSQVPYTSSHVPMLTNRNQDYVYRPHGGAMPPESYTETAGYSDHIVPNIGVSGRTTSTTVNQYHHGPISATSVSPECTYRPVNTPAAINGYMNVPRPQPIHYSPQKHSGYQNSRLMGHDPYGPTIPAAHTFQDTLVM